MIRYAVSLFLLFGFWVFAYAAIKLPINGNLFPPASGDMALFLAGVLAYVSGVTSVTLKHYPV